MIFIDELNLIQELRLIQALEEQGVKFCLSKKDEVKFRLIRRKFQFDYKLIENGEFYPKISQFISIDHKSPSTKVCDLSKPLIFPHYILGYLNKKWKINREIEFGFYGLVTNDRKSIIEKWYKDKFYKKLVIKNHSSFIKKVFMKLNFNFLLIQKVNNLCIWSSEKGRVFPIKSWDQSYYDKMLNTKFVLCPSGDFVWTYRFFEAILCGAIPVVNESCPLYEGFNYYLMQDELDTYQWSEDIIKKNLLLIKQKCFFDEFDINCIKEQIC